MKHYNLKLFILSLIFLMMDAGINSLNAQQRIETDIYGREIQNSNGKNLNYSRSETENLTPIPNEEVKIKTFGVNSGNTTISKDTVPLHTQNLFSVTGTSIGRNSMHSLDIDGNDTIDLICTGSLRTFGSGNFWYVLNYNPTDKTYKHIWTSKEYEDDITVLEIVDINDDGNYSVILGFDNGNLEVYDATSKELIKQASLFDEDINSIVFADADNDGEKELIISTDSETSILNALTLKQEFEISDGADLVRVGNVDTTSQNEIVLSSGTVYLLKNDELSTVWNYTSATGGLIELSDIDGDSYLEIIYAESWYNIKVYDVDTKTIKYTITTDIDIDALLLVDVTNDGIDDILYGDAQWGDVHCYNSVTQAELWSVDNPEHGVAAINFADLDSDGEEELIWSAGWTSTGEDFLYVYDVDSDVIEWQSTDIVGPFYAIAIGDVDGDFQDDIVAVSYESNSGYGSGIIIIMDAATKEVKWQSSGDFLYLVWTGIYDVAIHDIDSDGQNEIIIAAGRTYNGKIWIIDGKTKTIESEYQFPTSTDIDEFYALEVANIDDDETIEIIAATSSGIYVIDPTDWSLKWNVAYTGSSGKKPAMECADVTGDGNKEIVLCKGTINIINTDDHSLWSSTETDFLNIDTIDYNKDGTTDILACTSNGEIVIFDGNSRTKLLEIQPEVSAILAVKAIHFGDSLLYIYSCDGRINYYINDDKRTVSQYLAGNTAEVEGLKLLNNNEDTDIIIGTSISILEISGSTLHCAGMGIGIEKNIVSCDLSDGKIKLDVTGGTAPYSYDWSDNSTLDSISNLAPGSYYVTVKDNTGCSRKRQIELTEAYISADITVIDEGCIEKGSAQLIINHITEPYTVDWSNGYTDLNNKDLVEGDYSVIITDAKNCSYSNTIKISKDTVILDEYVRHLSCYRDSSGYIRVSALSGAYPIKFGWEHGGSGAYISKLNAGTYKVTATDQKGCKATLEIAVTQPDEISYAVLSSPDIADTPPWEGKVIIDSITGGTQPYEIYWPEFSKNSHYMDVLPVSTYAFVLTDDNGCQVYDSAVISSYTYYDDISNSDTCTTDTSNSDINNRFTSVYENEESTSLDVYPNPAQDRLYLNLNNSGIAVSKIALFNTSGELVLQGIIENNQTMIDLTGINTGLYVLRVTTPDSYIYKKVIVKK